MIVATSTETTRRAHAASWLLHLLAAAGCGGAASATPTSAASPPEAASMHADPEGSEGQAPTAKADMVWKAMSTTERAQYMKDVVTPRMAELFRAFDPKTFAQFDCATCHGPAVREGHFTMPSPSLSALPGNAAGFQALARDKPEWMRFMGRQVRPRMAALMGLDEVDMRNPRPDQFGCRNCHSMQVTAPSSSRTAPSPSPAMAAGSREAATLGDPGAVLDRNGKRVPHPQLGHASPGAPLPRRERGSAFGLRVLHGSADEVRPTAGASCIAFAPPGTAPLPPWERGRW